MKVPLDSQDNYLSILTDLGLTIRQAEVYISIIKSKPPTVKIIARNAKTERAEVYRVIPVLEKLGLIERFLGKPITYKAISITEGLKVLLDQDTEKHDEIQNRAKILIENLRSNDKQEPSQSDINYFLATGDAEMRELIKILNTVQTSLDVIINWKRLHHVVNRFYELYKSALERGVKIRFATCRPEGEQLSHIIQNLCHGTFEVKFTSSVPPATVVLIDEKYVDFVTSSNPNSNEFTGLWSNNPDLIATIREYFDTKWSSAL